MKVSFIPLGCAKNLVNMEQMMALCRDAGMELQQHQSGADVVVINTCGFIDSAKSEAIDTILQVAELKSAGEVGKILVTGCLSQRYKNEILTELPEVDGVLGTGSYSRIVEAVNAVAAGETPSYFDSIHAPVEELPRVVTTPKHYAFLRIAEGCDNHCAYCIIPSLRGKYRSRKMEDVLAEAQQLADSGVKEIIVIAQDITRYGIDLYGERKLPELLRGLCKMSFHWVRLHYLYPDEFTEELIDTIAEEEKILKYLDIPIQHINNSILRSMNRRGTGEDIRVLFKKLRERIPGVVLRTSLIAGLPGEGEAEFEELCEFLKEARIERVGVFPFSPEEGTPAAEMEHVDFEEAQRRADLIMQLQASIMDDFCESFVGKVVTVLVESYDNESELYAGRCYADSPDIDGQVLFEGRCTEGEMVQVEIEETDDGLLYGIMVK